MPDFGCGLQSGARLRDAKAADGGSDNGKRAGQQKCGVGSAIPQQVKQQCDQRRAGTLPQQACST